MRLLALTAGLVAIGAIGYSAFAGASPPVLDASAASSDRGASTDPRVLDGSDAGLEEGTITKMIIGLSDDGFLDPASAQFHSLRIATALNWTTGVKDVRSVCGFINLKGRNGSYVGFRPFNYFIHSGNMNVVVPPEEDRAAALASKLGLSLSACQEVLGVEFD